MAEVGGGGGRGTLVYSTDSRHVGPRRRGVTVLWLGDGWLEPMILLGENGRGVPGDGIKGDGSDGKLLLSDEFGLILRSFQ